MPTKRFSLKDELFNETKVRKIAGEIQLVYPAFESKMFIAAVLRGFPVQELMERLYWVRECLQKYLPSDYEVAVQILLEALPPPLDPTLTDDDFGDFIYGAYGNFVSEYGATAKNVSFSLAALREMTMRFSCEFPIRVFLNTFPEQTLRICADWVIDSHYHVRRLVSEGTRPSLPWGKNICLQPAEPLPFLDVLHADPTRFVTRSVANHLNDISKIDPELVLSTLRRWQELQQQSTAELGFITRHALRTLVKQGHPAALSLLGYEKAKVTVQTNLQTSLVQLGDALAFTLTLTSTSAQAQWLMVDYVVHFQKANGRLAPKTFKLKKLLLPAKTAVSLHKLHPLRPMTTRQLYAGAHALEIQVNGQRFGKQTFNLLH